MADAKLIGLEGVIARMRALPQALQATVGAELDKETAELVAAMQRAAPEESGTLRETIRAVPTDDPTKRKIVAGGRPTTKKIRSRKISAGRGKTQGVSDTDFAKALETGGNHGEFDYARAMEFGRKTHDGRHIPPHPFFFPTWRARKRAMVARLKAASRKTIRQLFPKETSGA
jgi:hypothetical protein